MPNCPSCGSKMRVIGPMTQASSCETCITILPTDKVDRLVKIVRCKDCRYWDGPSNVFARCNYPDTEGARVILDAGYNNATMHTYPDFGCVKGEMK